MITLHINWIFSQCKFLVPSILLRRSGRFFIFSTISLLRKYFSLCCTVHKLFNLGVFTRCTVDYFYGDLPRTVLNFRSLKYKYTDMASINNIISDGVTDTVAISINDLITSIKSTIWNMTATEPTNGCNNIIQYINYLYSDDK